MPSTVVIVVAAGSGTRMGTDRIKVLEPLQGMPVIGWCLRVFDQHPAIDEIRVVVRPGTEHIFESALIPMNIEKLVLPFIHGGAHRCDSVAAGLQALAEDPPAVVLIHDGARPFVPKDSVGVCVETALQHGAGVLAVPAKDTLRMVDEQGWMGVSVPRDKTFLVQTPQSFRFELITEAYQQWFHRPTPAQLPTDDAELVVALGHGVKMILGSYQNIKITTSEDLVIASALTRITHGNTTL